jgi:type III secretion system (T3SS) SseB-like protein
MQRTFFVPVQAGQAGALALRTGRLPSGERVGLAFTSETALSQTLGPAQQWIHLAAPALAEMLAPLGVGHIRIDPQRAVGSRPEGPPRLGRPDQMLSAAAASRPSLDGHGAVRRVA